MNNENKSENEVSNELQSQGESKNNLIFGDVYYPGTDILVFNYFDDWDGYWQCQGMVHLSYSKAIPHQGLSIDSYIFDDDTKWIYFSKTMFPLNHSFYPSSPPYQSHDNLAGQELYFYRIREADYASMHVNPITGMRDVFHLIFAAAYWEPSYKIVVGGTAVLGQDFTITNESKSYHNCIFGSPYNCITLNGNEITINHDLHRDHFMQYNHSAIGQECSHSSSSGSSSCSCNLYPDDFDDVVHLVINADPRLHDTPKTITFSFSPAGIGAPQTPSTLSFTLFNYEFQTVNVSPLASNVYESFTGEPVNKAVFRFSRSKNSHLMQFPLRVYYTLSGSAKRNVDFANPSGYFAPPPYPSINYLIFPELGSVVIPANQLYVDLEMDVINNQQKGAGKDLTVNIMDSGRARYSTNASTDGFPEVQRGGLHIDYYNDYLLGNKIATCTFHNSYNRAPVITSTPPYTPPDTYQILKLDPQVFPDGKNLVVSDDETLTMPK